MLYSKHIVLLNNFDIYIYIYFKKKLHIFTIGNMLALALKY